MCIHRALHVLPWFYIFTLYNFPLKIHHVRRKNINVNHVLHVHTAYCHYDKLTLTNRQGFNFKKRLINWILLYIKEQCYAFCKIGSIIWNAITDPKKEMIFTHWIYISSMSISIRDLVHSYACFVKGILWDRRWIAPYIGIFFPHMRIFFTEMHLYSWN